MSNNASINTLSEFLLQAKTQYMIFDIGRGIRKIHKQSFFEWENQQAPCPYPRQDHAWFCIVFWNEKVSEERFIWFIKLPLDENGLIIQASRNQFLEIIVQALGQDLSHTADTQAQLPENPYIFSPNQQQLADCNAHIRVHLNHTFEASPTLQAYMQSPQMQANEDQWTTFTLQELADYTVFTTAADNKAKNHQNVISANLKYYPQALLSCLFASLEGTPVCEKLNKALIHFHKNTKTQSLKALCLRAMCFQPSMLVNNYIEELINASEVLDVEHCVVIVGRYWRILQNEQILLNFMHKVAELDSSYEIFRSLYADLVKVPDTRQTMLNFIRNPERSNKVAIAIGSIFANTGKQH